jgi:thiol-disulfide isomerase/thioredoxin
MAQNKMTQKVIITRFNSHHDFLKPLENNPGLVIVKLGSTWCGPCKRIKPVLDSFSHQVPIM